MTKPVSNSRASATKTVYAAFELLKENGGTMALKDILERIPQRVNLNEWEQLIYEKTGYVRWGSIFHFYSLDCAKAGFLVKNNGIWTLTPEGEKAMGKGPDALMEAATTAYKKWAKENKKPQPETLDKEDDALVVSSEINIELMESRARESIVEHIRLKNPYEFYAFAGSSVFGDPACPCNGSFEKPSDPTIAEKFNTYRFADHREKVIDLLKRVTTVSVRGPASEPGWRWCGGWV